MVINPKETVKVFSEKTDINPKEFKPKNALLASEGDLVRSPRFEPGSSAWQVCIVMSESVTLMSYTKLDYDRTYMVFCGLSTCVDGYIGF
jgi:hypothetical protein